MSNSYSLSRTGASLFGRLSRTVRELWLVATGVVMLTLISADLSAQLTYFSKSTATDFNSTASWGLNTDGSGAQPAAISNANNFVIRNNANMTLSGPATVRQLTLTTGSLTITNQTLTVSRATGNNATFSVQGGTLNLSGTGSLVINGNYTHSSGFVFQSGGSMVIDPNNNNDAATSVASGTHTFSITTANGLYNGGTITIVDPPVNTYAASSTRTISMNTGVNATQFAGTHTFIIGDGVSSTPGNSDGFALETYAGSTASIRNLTVNGGSGTNRYVGNSYGGSTSWGLWISGNLVINANSEFRTTSAANFVVGGNLTNNGTLTTSTTPGLTLGRSFTVAFSAFDNLVLGANVIGGTGVFRNGTAPTALFQNIIINNPYGVIFNNAAQLVLNSPIVTSVQSTLVINQGTINLNGANFWLGVSGTPGTLTYTAGGFNNGTFTKWLNASTLPTSIGASAGLWPFSANGANRNFQIAAPTSPSSAGTLSVSHNPASGLNTITAVETMDRESNASWTVTAANGFSGGTYLLRANGDAVAALTAVGSSPRILKASAVVGTHSAATGTVASPAANRTAVAFADVTGTFTLGYAAADLGIFTVQSGAWDDPATWSNGAVPGVNDQVSINPGHNITVTTTGNVAGRVNMLGNSTLTVSAGDLTISAPSATNLPNAEGAVLSTGVLTSVTVSGTGTLSIGSAGAANSFAGMVVNGTLNVNNTASLFVFGYLDVTSTAFFFQTGSSTVTIDGNEGGAAATSVSSNPLVRFSTGSLTFNGGTFLIVDPHASTTASNSLLFNPSAGNVNASVLHTFQFGDGVSTDAGGNATAGFRINQSGTPRLAFGQLLINASAGTNRHIEVLSNNVSVIGNLTITSGDLRINTGNTFHVNGNVTNNGTLTTTGTLAFQNYQNLTATPSVNAQVLSGSGTFRNLSASPTGGFGTILFNNTGASGVTFSGTGWSTTASTVVTALTFTNGRVNIGAGTFTLGTATASGTLNYTAGGFTGGTVRRGFSAATVNIGTALGQFPFVSATNDQRHFFFAGTVSTAGFFQVNYADAAGFTSVTPFADAGINVAQTSNASWTTSGTAAITANTGAVRLRADGLGIAQPAAGRVTLATGAAPGTSIAGTGTVNNPEANKNTIASVASMGQVYRFGRRNTIESFQTGLFEDGTTWVGGVAPVAGDPVLIRNGHNVTVNAVASSCGNLSVNVGGTLTVSGSTLTVGTTDNNNILGIAGSLIVSGGALNVNGNVAIFNGATFTQTAGTITVDGNSGSAATSVAEGTQIFAIGTAATPYATGGLTLNGGSIIIVDPHASTTATATSNATFAAFLSAGSEFQATHTIQFGNGSVTNNGGTVGGYRVDVAPGAGRLLLGALVVNAPGGTNREVNFINHTGVLGNFTVTAGQANLSANATFGGNVLVDNTAVLTQAAGGAVNFGIPFDASTILPNPTAQSVSVAGTGIIRNNPAAASATANFASILVGNTSTTGVTFNALNQITNAPANAVTVSGSITFGGTGIDARATAPSANGLVWGVFGTTPAVPTGSLTINANSGFTTGSTFGRFYAAATGGTTIGASTDPTATTSRYPFVSPTGLNRSAFIERTGGSAAGVITSTFTHVAGSTGSLSVTDGAYTITNKMNSTWSFGVAGTGIAQTSVEVAIVAPEAFGVLPPAAPNVRIMRSNDTVIGTHQAGTTTPGGQRVITTVADLTGQPLTLGINSADLPVFTVQSGDWDDVNTWNIAAVPLATDGIQILAGHTVTVNDAVPGGSGLTIASTGALNIVSTTLTITGNVLNNGTLTVNGGALNIGGLAAGTGLVNNSVLTINSGALTLGTGNNDRGFTNGAAGVWTVAGGTMTVNGNIILSGGGTWNQSGGTIVIDPQGSTSVAGGTHSLSIGTNLLNLTGGTVEFVDPNSGAGNSIHYNVGFSYNTPVGSTHTWRFGNGISTTGTTGSFNLNTWVGSGRILLGNVEVNTLHTTTANRVVTTTYGFGIRGDLTISSGGDFRGATAGGTGQTVFVEGNVLNNGFMTMLGTLQFGRYESGTETSAPNAQSLGGTGTFRNLATGATANLTGITVRNSSVGGVTFNVPLFMSGTLNMTLGIINTTSANVLTMGTTTGLAGGTATVTGTGSWVNGPMRRVFPANQTSNGIIGSTTALFPVGTGSGYYPARLLPRTTAGGAVTLEVQAFNGNSGINGITLQSLNGARRWEWSIVSGAANISPAPLGVFFGCQDPSMVSGNALAFAATSNGTYDLPDAGTGPIGSTFDTGMLYFSSAVPTNPTDATTQFIGFGQTGPLEVASLNGFQYTGFTQRSATNVNTIGFVASMLGSTGGQTLNSVTITYTGTNPADIAANGVSFWVGTSLGPVTQLGSNVSFSGSTATISGLTQTLLSGNNWFFVRLNVAATAVLGNTVDAQIAIGGLVIAPTAPSTDASPYPAAAIDPAGNLIINYCMPNFTTSNGCGANDFLTSFQLADINVNPLTCIIPSTPPSYQLRSETTTLEQGATYAVNFNVGTGGTQGVGLWIDFNDDGTFGTTEFFGGSTFASGSAGSFNITIPGGAPLGAHRMRVMNRYNTALLNSNACSTIDYGAATDYTVTVTGPTARTLASVTAPARSGYLLQNSTNNNVFRFDLAVTGSLGALNLTSVTVNYAGTNQADIAANGVTLWTGTSTAPTTQLGTAQSFSAGSATFSGLTTALNTGTSFLWVRLNTANPATLDNLVDVSIPTGGLVINATGGATPTGTQPAAALNATGDYRVWYCAVPGIGGGVNCSNTFRISATNLVGATNTLASSGVCAVDQGNLFSIVGTSGTPGADLAQGSTYTVNVTPTDAGNAIGVWIDWNNNSVFEVGENIGVINASAPGANPFTINTPFPLVNGPRLMRVRTRSSGTMGTGDACTNFAGGQTIDYWIEVVDAPNCSGLLPSLPTSVTATTSLTGALCIAGNAPVNATFSPALIPAGGLSYQWQYNNGSWINVGSAIALPSTTLALDANGTFAAGQYRMQILCNGTPTGATLNPVTINILNPTVTNTTSPTTRCGLGNISLTATSASPQISWFAAPTGGSPLGTGASYTANLTSIGSTTFYVAASELGSPANVGFPVTGTGTFFINWGIVLDVTETVQINSVTVYPTSDGNVVVSVRESNNSTELGTSGVVAVTNGGGTTPTVITFPTPVTLTPGTGYRIVLGTGTTANLVRQNSNPGYPAVSGPVSIVASEWGGTTTSNFYFFYNVNFTGSCSSARVPVAVTATAPPAVTLTASGSPVCSNTLVTLTASSAFPYTYAFPDAGVTQTAADQGEVTPVISHDNGSRVFTYNVNATSPTCNSSASVAVTVNPAPQIVSPTMTPSSGQVCVGGGVSFNATVNAVPNVVFAEGFDSGIPGTWTVTSNHTGTNNEALRTWNSQQSGVAVPVAGETYVTPDGSRFVLSDADVGGSTSVTRTELRSPAFSTVGQTGLSLELEHYFNWFNSSDTALVQMSLNGTTWTNVGVVSNGATLGVDYGSLTAFTGSPGPWSVPVGFENQPTVYVRLYFRSSWGFYWAVNRIRVLAPPVSSPVLAWAGPGWGGASTAAASRTNLTLTDAGNHTFSATQNGCTTSITPFNVVVNAPPVANITASPSVTTLCPGETVDFNANESAGSGTITGIGWTRNGVNIPSANTGLYTATQDGLYEVTVTNSNGCQTSSSYTLNPIVYTVTTTVGANGVLNSVPTGNNHNCGTNPAYTADPNPCYYIASFVVDGTPVDLSGVTQGANYTHTFTNISANHTIDVTFAQIVYGVGFSSAGSNGSDFTVSPAIVNGVTTINCGDTQTWTFSPVDPCDEITAVEINGVPIGTPTSYTVTGANNNISIVVRSDKRRYNVAVQPFSNGVLGVNGSNPGGNIAGLFNNLLCGTTYNYTVTGASGFVLDGIQIWDATNTTLVSDLGPVGTFSLPSINASYTIRAFFTTQPNFNVFSSPIPLIVPTYPSCVITSQSLAGCTPSSQLSSFTTGGGNQDGWFRFRVPAFSTGIVQIRVESAGMDVGIALTDELGNIIQTENASTPAVGAGERLTTTVALTPGTFYRIGVRNMGTTTAGAFTICVNSVRPLTCTSIPNGSLCSTFSGAYTGANQYTYRFINASNPSETWTRTISGGANPAPTVVAMSAVRGLRYGTVYNVEIDQSFTFANSAGGSVTVPIASPGTICTFTTLTQPSTNLAAANRWNGGTGVSVTPSTVLSTSWVCGVVDYEWRVNSSLSVNRGFPERFLRVNALVPAGVNSNGVYNIDIRPYFSDGTLTGSYAGDWGTLHDINVVGFLSGQASEDASALESADAVDLGNGITASLYPNPNSGDVVFVQLNGVDADKVQIRVLDGLGRVVYVNQFAAAGSLNATLNFNEQLTGGLYLVEYNVDGKVMTQRMVVTK